MGLYYIKKNPHKKSVFSINLEDLKGTCKSLLQNFSNLLLWMLLMDGLKAT